MSEQEQLIQLRERSRQFETVLHAIPDLIIGLNAGGRITFMSDAALAYIGTTRETSEIEPGEWTLSSLASYDPVFSVVATRITETHPITEPFEARSDKRKRDFLVTFSETEDGSVIVMRDISPQRDLTRFKDEVMKLASHDLRSPLALIIGYASLVSLDLPPDSPVQDYITSIQSATERMTGLLDALMTVEQLRSSPLELNSEVVFRDVVQEALKNLRPQAQQKSQMLMPDVNLDGMPNVSINRTLVREVMENLLGNAIKYSEEGKTIWLRAWYDDEQVKVTVRDEAFGIAAEQIPKIFEAFYRGKQPSGQKSDGRGMGLYLVKTIVQRHNGDIWVESEPGKGSTFGFWLPLK